MDMVAPIVPNAQENKAPGIILQGLQQGFAAIAEINRQRQQSELALQEMEQRDRLASEQHQLDREQLAQQGYLAEEKMGIDRITAGAALENANLRTRIFNAGITKTLQAQKDNTDFLIARTQFEQKAAGVRDNLKLEDPEFQATNPAQWWKNVQDFKAQYGTSVGGSIPVWIKRYNTLADQQKVPFKEGADLVGTIDKNGNYAQKFSGPARSRMVPVWQLMERYGKGTDEDRADVVKGLMGAGQEHIVTQLQKNDPSQKGTSGRDVPATTSDTTTTLPDRTAAWLQSSGAIDWGNFPQNQVPPAFQMKRLKNQPAGSYDPGAGINEDDVNQAGQVLDNESAGVGGGASSGNAVQFDPTQTDKTIAQALAAHGAGAPPDQIAGRLQQMGIDPDLFLSQLS